MIATTPAVPPGFRGLWRRSFLRLNGEPPVEDRTTRVFWMQEAHWHADLRIPGDRDGFAGVGSLAECDRGQLLTLARQEGFCGITRLDDRIMSWIRLHDLRPNPACDAGRVALDGNRLAEHGIDGAYEEEWRLIAPQDGREAERLPDGRIALYARDHRMTVRPRDAAPAGADPYAAPADLDRAALVWRVGLEIALWEREAADWRCVLSTHPWIERQTEERSHGDAADQQTPGP